MKEKKKYFILGGLGIVILGIVIIVILLFSSKDKSSIVFKNNETLDLHTKTKTSFDVALKSSLFKKNDAQYNITLYINEYSSSLDQAIYLKIIDPNNKEVKELANLEYTDEYGFLLNNNIGKINLVSNYELKKDHKVDTWQLELKTKEKTSDEDVLKASIVIQEASPKESVAINPVSLNNIAYQDDYYIYAGDVYYLNPYDITMTCNAKDVVKDARSNPNGCMKWYEISEDDKYISLILNNNFSKTIPMATNLNEQILNYLQEQTASWDNRLVFGNDYKIDNIDYSQYKARIFSLEELEYLLEFPTFTLDNYREDEYLNKYRSWLLDNLGTGSKRWVNGAYFTSTNLKDDISKNYALNIEGFALSVSDENTYGIRPIITIEKSILGINREIKRNMGTFIYDINSARSFYYQLKNMHGLGINKVYLNYNNDKFAWFMSLATSFGIKLIPNIKDLSLETIDNILKNGYIYNNKLYNVQEINLDLNLDEDKILDKVKDIDNLVNKRVKVSYNILNINENNKELLLKLSSFADNLNIKYNDYEQIKDYNLNNISIINSGIINEDNNLIIDNWASYSNYKLNENYIADRRNIANNWTY